MNWIETMGRELYGLFVDDAGFAIAILIWLGLFRLLSRSHAMPAWAGALALFAGLAAVLCESVLRFARSHQRR